MLCAQHALLHQTIHAFKDMNFCKYNLVDSCGIINNQRADITKTVAVAKGWGITRPLYVLLKNCNQVMQNNIDKDLLNKIKPNALINDMINKLLKSGFTQPIKNRKPLEYRFAQILGQFAFTGSLIRPLALQWLLIKSLVSSP
jgi:hypothetical protein